MPATARDEILSAVNSITNGGHRMFTIDEVIPELRARCSQFKESTVRTHIMSRLCANAPDNHAVTHPDFERVGRGEYRWRG
jgi:hypothetical protein